MSNTKKTLSVKESRLTLSEVMERRALDKFPVPAEYQRKPIHKRLWEDLMGSVPSTWFLAGELPLLKAYINTLAKLEKVQASLFDEPVLIETMRGDAKANPYFTVMAQLQSLCTQMAVKLRLTPSMRFDPSRAEKARKDAKALDEAANANSHDQVRNPRAGLLFGRGIGSADDDDHLLN